MMVLDLTDKCIKLFPAIIDISDGELRSDDGFFSKNLSDAWHDAEKSVIPGSDIEFMLWAIYCIFHELAREKFQNNDFKAFIYEIEIEDITQKYIDVLKESIGNN